MVNTVKCFADVQANCTEKFFIIVTTVPLSVSYGGAKPLGPWVRTSNFVPWWVTGWSREGSTRAQKHRTVVC